MPLEPPPFQEADRCDVCKCSFNAFRRRHHCRCCGRTLCHEHSSSQMALPQFNIHTAVRVCADCFNDSTRSSKADSKAYPNAVNNVADEVSRLDIHSEADSKTEATTQQPSTVTAIECKCGMPLCICAAPAPTTDARPWQMKAPSTSISQPNPKPKKPDPTPKNRGSTSNSRNSSLFNPGQTTNDSHGTPQRDYEVNGEGLREAIKSGDTAAVRKLLSEGVDANYRDKQGLSLLHLAALFNRTDIVFILMGSGASMDYKNAQGETPLDCAPVTLQYKMKQKLEERGQ